jgi:hypothetical protein
MRRVQQRHIGPPVAQQSSLLARPTQHDVDGDRARLRRVRVEEVRQ